MVTFYIIVFLSWFAHLSLTISTAAKKYGKNFKAFTWLEQPKNFYYILSSLLLAVVLSLSATLDLEDNINLYIISFKTAYVVAITFGAAQASIIRKLLKLVFKDK